QQSDLVFIFRGTGLAQDGNEGLRESAFGEQAAQQVGDAEGHPEGIGQRTRAVRGRDDDVPHQTGDAGKQSEAADGGGGPEQTHARPGSPYFGPMRMAPSRRMVSPLSMSFVRMLWTSFA